MNLGDSIRTGVKWLMLGSTGGQILDFAFGIILARLLVPADFGMIVTIQIFTGFAAMLATGGMGQSLIRAKNATDDEFHSVFTLQLALGILIFAGFFLAAPWFARYFENPLYTDLLRVSALSFVLRPFALVRIAWLNRQMDFRKRALVEIAGSASTGVASALMAWAGLGVWSLTLSGLVGAAIVGTLYFVATPLRLRVRFDAEVLRRHSGFGLKITANDFLDYVRDQSTSLILSKTIGPSSLGLFNKARSLATMPNRIMTPATGQTVFRALSKVQDDLDQTKYVFYRTITLLMVYVSPSLIGLWWVAEPFVRVIYGEKWLSVAEPMQIIVLAGFLRTIWIPCGLVLGAQNRLTQGLVGEVVSLFVALPAYFIGLRWGLDGVAWALAFCALFNTIYAYVLVYRTIPTRVVDLVRALAPVLLLDAILFAALALVHVLLVAFTILPPPLYLTVMIVAGVLTYGSAFLFIPIPALKTEAARWRQKIKQVLMSMSRPFR